MILKRIYAQSENGMFLDTGKALNAAGKAVTVGKQTNLPVPKSKLKQGTVIMKNQNFQNMKSIQNPTIGLGESTGGQLGSFRDEFASTASQRTTIEIEISNASADNTEEVIIGDGFQLAALKLGKSLPYAPSNDITITGTYGAVTESVLKDIPKSTEMRFHGFNIQSFDNSGTANQNFFGNNSFRTLEANLANKSLIDEPVPLQDLIKNNSFQVFLRDDPNWRFSLSGYTGLLFRMPPATKIKFITTVVSFGVVRGMKQVGTF